MRCSNCGSENPPGSRFCGDCGVPLEDGAPVLSPEARGPLPGERRHLTVLFCDLVNSTSIATQLDPEEWREVVANYHRTAAQAIERFGGYIAQYLALQLHFSYEVCTPEMGTTSLGLVGTPPQRPCDDVGGLNAPVGELDGDAADFLDRPADQARRFCGRGGRVFLGGTALAWWRMAVSMAKASITRETCLCQPCQERGSL